MKPAIKIEQLSAGYEHVSILKDISCQIEQGKITTVIGPNGCGKSTLLKTIGRILKKQGGHIYLQDERMDKMPTKEIAKHLALLSQSPSAPEELKVEELVSYGRYPHRKNVNRLTAHDKEVIEWAMQATKTDEFRSRTLSQLSGGQRQRVWLAMSLAQETRILLLDEPTTYLDMAHQLEVLNIVKSLNEEHGCTIVMVLHDINHAARFSDHLIAMKQGEIIRSGTPEEIISQEVLREVFQIDARIFQDPELNIPVCYSYHVLQKEPERQLIR